MPIPTPSRSRVIMLACAVALGVSGITFGMNDPASSSPPSSPPSGGRMGAGVKSSDDKSGDELVTARVAADVASITPSEKFLLSVVLDIEPHWHIYWENAGASGAPTEIAVKAPPGYLVGKTLFPRPQIIDTSDGRCYGYENRTVLFVEVTPPANATSLAEFQVDASWLVCKSACKMGSGQGTLSLPVVKGDFHTEQPLADDVATFKQRLPKPIANATGTTIDFDGKEMVVSFDRQPLPATIEFFPNPSPGVEFGEVRIESQASVMRMIVPVTLSPQNALGKPMRLAGVIGAGQGLDAPCFTFDLPLTDDGRLQRN